MCDYVCVSKCRGSWPQLLATILPVTEPSSGTSSSFHQASFLRSENILLQKLSNELRLGDCWSPQPIKAPNKTARPPYALFDMADRPKCCWEMQSLRESCAALCAAVKLSSLLAYTSAADISALTHVCSSLLGKITKLKIDRNPFAKGFRDPGRNRYMENLTKHTHTCFTAENPPEKDPGGM